jgi:Mlc titration factor MtfA (ptsG expression regulator)
MPGLLRSLLGGAQPAVRFDPDAWSETLSLPVFAGLPQADQDRLRDLTQHLLAEKTFSAAGGAEVDGYVCTVIAAFAALPVLNLGQSAYGDWREIVVYPGEFLHEGHEMDEVGVVHHVRHVRSGEAMYGGPLVLSWDDVAASGSGEGYNVVIHEFAHKLDMKNGAVDGLPPLHSGMRVEDWSAAFTAAYQALCQQVDAGQETDIDPYAAESPAEYFAVLSEYFFEAPSLVRHCCPDVYAQLRLYYRQDPLARMEHVSHDPTNP